MLTLPPIMFAHFKGFYYPHYSTRDCVRFVGGWPITNGPCHDFQLGHRRVSRTYSGATQVKGDR